MRGTRRDGVDLPESAREIGGLEAYVRHLLPLWFDVQTIEHADGAGPARAWRFG